MDQKQIEDLEKLCAKLRPGCDTCELYSSQGRCTVTGQKRPDPAFGENCSKWHSLATSKVAKALSETLAEVKRLQPYAPKHGLYDVCVTRLGIGFVTIQVAANSEEEARQHALEEAGDCIFTEKDANYEVEHVSEIE